VCARRVPQAHSVPPQVRHAYVFTTAGGCLRRLTALVRPVSISKPPVSINIRCLLHPAGSIQSFAI
jgi:hypothetical protein